MSDSHEARRLKPTTIDEQAHTTRTQRGALPTATVLSYQGRDHWG